MPERPEKSTLASVQGRSHADSGWHADIQVRSLMAQLMDGLQYLHSQVGCTSALLSALHGA